MARAGVAGHLIASKWRCPRPGVSATNVDDLWRLLDGPARHHRRAAYRLLREQPEWTAVRAALRLVGDADARIAQPARLDLARWLPTIDPETPVPADVAVLAGGLLTGDLLNGPAAVGTDRRTASILARWASRVPAA